MRWFLYALAGLAGLIGAVLAIGAMRPRGHVARRTARFRQTPEVLWSTIRDVGNAPNWRTDLRGVDVLPDQGGHAMFRERSAHNAVLYRIDTSEAPRRLVTTIADDSLAFGGSWTIELAADGDGTRVTITERGEVKTSFFRFMSMFFDPGATAERQLDGGLGAADPVEHGLPLLPPPLAPW